MTSYLPAIEIPKSITSVGKKIWIKVANIKIQRTEQRPAPHELNDI